MLQRRRETRDNQRFMTPTHAGGIVIRVREGERQVLLVRGTRAPHDWVLPKGRIERGETPEETARREVQEEAGVDAEVVRYAGRLDFERDSREIRAAYFEMRFVQEIEAAEDREIRWATPAEAIALVRFEDTGRLIRQILVDHS